jgi:cleavage and polyadenylation specificity factor subunit 2
MAGIEGNVILLTSRGEESTLARDLFDAWQASQDSERQYGSGKIGFPHTVEQRLDIEVSPALRRQSQC